MPLNPHDQRFGIMFSYKELLNRGLDSHIGGDINSHFNFITRNHQIISTHQIDSNARFCPLYEPTSLTYPLAINSSKTSADSIAIGASVYEHMGQTANWSRTDTEIIYLDPAYKEGIRISMIKVEMSDSDLPN